MDTLPARTKEKLAQAKKKGGCKNFREDVINFPTPTASDEQKYRLKGNSQGTKCLSALARKGELSQDQTNNNTNGKSLVLNPNWVEQLMGLQVGWTDCVFSEME
jgi:hypothetical protein